MTDGGLGGRAGGKVREGGGREERGGGPLAACEQQ